MKNNNLWTILTAAGALGVGLSAAYPARAVAPRVVFAQEGREFMMHAAQGNIAEVRLGQLAQRKASNPAVRRFAQRMVEDHRAALNEMRVFAERRNFDMHVGMGDENHATYERLQGLSGREFDRAYMRTMVDDHEKDVHEWEHHADFGRDNQFNQWVSNKLPTLRHHLQMARNIWRRIG